MVWFSAWCTYDLWTIRRWRHESGGQDDDHLRKELPFCAYLRAAAALICLDIPIQRNMAHFPFLALALVIPDLSSANDTDCERR